MVQFLSSLQEAPRVINEAISVACTTQSWEIFAVSVEGFSETLCLLTKALPFFLFRFVYCYTSDGTFDQVFKFILLIWLVTSCQLPYHTANRCLSQPNFIRATHCHNMTVKQTPTLLFSNEICVILGQYVHSKNNRYSAEMACKRTARHYMWSELMCGVL